MGGTPILPGGALGLTIAATALLCGIFTAACEATHSALAGTFGGLAVVMLVVPPLILTSERLSRRVLLAGVSISAVASAWLLLPIAWTQWWECTAVLCSYTIAIGGSVGLLQKLGINAIVASAIVVAVALAWLAWPIWLSPYLAGRQTLVNWLVFAHPLLTLNGILIDQGIWTERPHMYAWTALNQDVSYSIPTNIGWCVIVDFVLGVATAAIGTFLTSKGEEHESTRIDTNLHESDS
jgi:hypothetical protein